MRERYPTKGALRLKAAADSASTDDDIITSDELADRLHIHRLTPVVWRRDGRGPPYVTADDVRLVRYRWHADVLPWLERCRKIPKPNNASRRITTSQRRTRDPGSKARARLETAAKVNGCHRKRAPTKDGARMTVLGNQRDPL